MNINYKSIFFLLLSLVFIPNLMAQDKPEETRAIKAIKNIKNGVLLIRLSSKNNKIKELNRLIASPNVSEDTKKDLKKILHETVSEIKAFNTKVYYAFTEVYNFSEVLFFYDTATVALKQGKQQGFFLDENLKVNPALSLNNNSFALLRYGNTDSQNSSGIEAFVFMDDQFKDLTKPFPYYMKLKSFGQRLVSIFSSRTMAQIKVIKRVTKLNQKLEKFYDKVLIAERLK